MKCIATLLCLCTLIFFNCSEKRPVDRMNDEQLHAYADELAHTYIITDGHVDLPYRLRFKNFRVERKYMTIPVSSDEGDFDYNRAKKGGLDAPFMSIYIPANMQKTGNEKRLADSLIDMINGIIKANPDKFAEGNTPKSVAKN